MHDDHATLTMRDSGDTLSRGVLSGFEVMAQSIAEIAPSAVIGSTIALVAATSGATSWLTWLIGGVILVLTAYVLTQLANRYKTTGGLYSLAARAAGPTIGYFIAWFALITYLGVIAAVVFQIAEFVAGYLNLSAFGVPDTPVTSLVIGLLGVVVAGAFSYRNVQLSSRTMLIAESISVMLILTLLVVVLVTHHGSVFNAKELTLHGVSTHQILLGMPLVMFSFGGFETCTVLGQEARNPRRMIPISLIGSVAIASVFFIVCSYVLVLGFQGSHANIADTSNILATAAGLAGIPWFAYIVDVGVILSMFSVIVAAYNVGSRLLLTLGREDMIPSAFGRVHRRNHTPANSVVFIGSGCVVGMVIVAATQANVVNAFGDMGSLAGYGQTVMYLLALVAVVVMLVRRRSQHAARELVPVITAAVVGAVALGYLLYSSFVPMPAFPVNVYVYVFFGLSAASVLGYAWKRRRPEALAKIGTTVDEHDQAEVPTPAAIPLDGALATEPGVV